MTRNYCTSCGARVSPGTNFCSSCGARIGIARLAAQQAQVAEAAAGVGPVAGGGVAASPVSVAATPVGHTVRILRSISRPPAIFGHPLSGRTWALLGAGLVIAGMAGFFILSSHELRFGLTTPPELIAYAVLQATAFLLLVRFLDLYEREPLIALAVMALWGAVGATALAMLGNDFVDSTLSRRVGKVFGAAISAPPVEEGAKGLALLAAFALSGWAARRFGVLEFEGVTDGIVYGAAIGIGFALAEDIWYMIGSLLEHGYAAGESVFLMRRDFFGPMMPLHAISTAAFGAGLGLATWSRRWIARIGFPILGFIVAMLIHATRNGFPELVLVIRYGWGKTADFMAGPGVSTELAQRMQTTYDDAYHVLRWIQWGFLVAFFLVIVLWVRYQKRVVRDELQSEVAEGTLTEEEWRRMPEYLERSRFYWQLLRNHKFERWRLRRRIDNELADLAFLRWRIRNLGADSRWLEPRRQRIANLKAHDALEEGLQAG
jgi:RsiW-degrading membrane proteinase PrsW (M82 family)